MSDYKLSKEQEQFVIEIVQRLKELPSNEARHCFLQALHEEICHHCGTIETHGRCQCWNDE